LDCWPLARLAFCLAAGVVEKLDGRLHFADIAIRVRSLKFLIALTIGVIRDPRVRRWFMFYSLLVALVQIFLGVTFLWAPLLQNIWVFIAYWIACAWLTIAALLLALYDMIAIRAAGRQERRRLEEEYARRKSAADDEDPA